MALRRNTLRHLYHVRAARLPCATDRVFLRDVLQNCLRCAGNIGLALPAFRLDGGHRNAVPAQRKRECAVGEQRVPRGHPEGAVVISPRGVLKSARFPTEVAGRD